MLTLFSSLQPEIKRGWWGMNMSEILLNEIHDAVRKGAKIAIGRNYYGRTRLKIVQGPFGMRAKRVSLCAEELQKVFATISLRRVAA
jgi:hypothetical protein